MLVRDIMLGDPMTATPDAHLPELAELLRRRGFRHVPIVEDGKVVGIVSDRDIKGSMTSASLAADGEGRERLLKTLTAGDVMTRHLVTIDPTAGVEEAARLMVTRRISALPVTDGDRLLGIVTETDILRLFVRALGVLEPSSRVEVLALDPAAGLTDLVRAVEEAGCRISSAMTLAAPDGKREVVLRLGTMDPGPAVHALEAGGHAVRPGSRGARRAAAP
jgi:acetoin utilization protein AcuB